MVWQEKNEEEGKYFSYVVLPFGFSLSPYFFTKVLRPVVKYLRSQGVRLSLYVDDFLICASASVITDHTDLVIHTLNDLGLKINLEKSILRPCQIIDYLGYTIDATGEYVSIKAQKARDVRIKRQIKAVINKGRASARVLAKTAGLCVSVAWRWQACLSVGSWFWVPDEAGALTTCLSSK